MHLLVVSRGEMVVWGFSPGSSSLSSFVHRCFSDRLRRTSPRFDFDGGLISGGGGAPLHHSRDEGGSADSDTVFKALCVLA